MIRVWNTGVIPIVRKNFSSGNSDLIYSCNVPEKPFKSLFSLIKYQYNGGCSITVSTRGCGPRGEGSTPSFRPRSFSEKDKRLKSLATSLKKDLIKVDTVQKPNRKNTKK